LKNVLSNARLYITNTLNFSYLLGVCPLEMTMKSVNYDIADATVVLAYNPTVLEENTNEEEIVAAGLLRIFDDFCHVLGMSCDVSEEIGSENGESVWKLHVLYQQAQDSTGAEKEMERMIFLENLAEFEAQVIQTEAVIQTTGVRFAVEMAEHNKAEYSLYQMEMAKPFVVEPKKVKFAGEAMMVFYVNIDQLERRFGRDNAFAYLENLEKFVANGMYNVNAHGISIPKDVSEEEHIWGYNIKFVKYADMTVDDEPLANILLAVKDFYAELAYYLRAFPDESFIELHVREQHQTFFDKMHMEHATVQ
jgi:hypothetical protein